VALLLALLRGGDIDRALVFTRTKRGANRLAKELEQARVAVAAIHGNKSQPARERALDAFKRGRTRVVVATDIAARGIDVKGLSHVVNFELPHDPESYVHRVGRTGRAGASGVALSLCSAAERPHLLAIERLTRRRLERLEAPAGFPRDAEPAPHEVEPRAQRHARGGAPRGQRPARAASHARSRPAPASPGPGRDASPRSTVGAWCRTGRGPARGNRRR
jgi:ATP-dependent RNA helicase RhlE